MTKGPAMTREEAIQALETGISMVEEAEEQRIFSDCHRRDGNRKYDHQQCGGIRSSE